MGEIRSFSDLIAWRKARELVKLIYVVSRQFPKEELYGLSQQIRRAVISVSSNIAEGYGRGSLKDYIRFLQTARGSLYEVQTQLLLANDLGYIDNETLDQAVEKSTECAKLLQGLISSLNKTEE